MDLGRAATRANDLAGCRHGCVFHAASIGRRRGLDQVIWTGTLTSGGTV
jgi:hypothetical protein